MQRQDQGHRYPDRTGASVREDHVGFEVAGLVRYDDASLDGLRSLSAWPKAKITLRQGARVV